MSLGDRCLFTALSGPPILPFEVNSNYQIVETPGSVMIMLELFHEVRIVRLNGRHVPPEVRSWNGDSIGHYERGTLVVDTANFNGKWPRGGEHLHVVERLTRIDSETILYRATLEDPSVYTRPWTIEYLFRATKGPIYEYGCHEGNYALPAILRDSNSQVKPLGDVHGLSMLRAQLLGLQRVKAGRHTHLPGSAIEIFPGRRVIHPSGNYIGEFLG